MAITAITAVPNTDHKIFYNTENGHLFERTATVFAYDDECDQIITLLAEGTDKDGIPYVPAKDVSEYDRCSYKYIGDKGDLVTPKQLEAFFITNHSKYAYDIPHILRCIRGLLKVSSQAEDTVHICLNAEWYDGEDSYNVFAYIDSDWFANVARHEDRCVWVSDFLRTGKSEALDDTIITPLAEYAWLLGREELNVEFDIHWFTDPDYSDEDCDRENEVINKIFSLCYKPIETYIKDGIKATIAKLTTEGIESDDGERIEQERKEKYRNMYKF